MASKKNNPNVQKRIAERKAFVAARPNLSKDVARKRFFVQTRAAELEAAGKTVDRAALRKKFETGTIQRAGFQTAQDIQKAANRRSVIDSASKAPLPGPSDTGRTPSPMTRTKAATTRPDMMAMRRKPIANFKTGSVQPSKPKPDIATQAVDKATNVFNSVFGRKGIISSVSRSTGKMLSDYSNSLARTFTNPWINAGGRAIGKNPNLPTAGAKEAAITTAFAAADLATLKSASAGRAAISSALKSSKLGTAAARGVESSRIVRGGTKIVQGTKKLPQVAKNEIGLWRKTENVVSAASNTRTVASAARSAGSKPGQVGGVRFTNPKPVKAAAKKAAPVKATAKKAAPVKATAKKTAPAKKTAAKKSAQRPVLNVSKTPSVEGEIKSIFSGITDAIVGAGKDISRGTTGKAARENAARTVTKKAVAKKAVAKKAVAKKAAVPKVSAPVKAPATKSVPKTSTGRTSTSPAAGKRVEGVPTFKNLEDYNKFMDSGGKEALRRMSNEQRLTFEQNNRALILARSRARAAQSATRASAAERRAAVVARRNKMMLERMARKGLTFTE